MYDSLNKTSEQQVLKPSSHKIDKFLFTRSISDTCLAQISRLSEEKIHRILNSDYDPLSSEIISIHQGLNLITDCSLSELLDTEGEISPTKQQLTYISKIKQLTNEILLLIYPDAVNLEFEKLIERDSYANSFCRMCLIFSTQLNNIIENFELRTPSAIQYFKDPAEGTLKLNNIYMLAEKKGKMNLRHLLLQFNAFESGNTENVIIDPQNLSIARMIFNPYHDFKLSEIKKIISMYFNSNSEGGASESDLIHSPAPTSDCRLDSSLVKFKTSFILLGQALKALLNHEKLTSKTIIRKLAEIKALMGEVEPSWENISTGNVFLRKSSRTLSEMTPNIKIISTTSFGHDSSQDEY